MKFFLISFVIISTLLFSLVFPLAARADDSTPPPPADSTVVSTPAPDSAIDSLSVEGTATDTPNDPIEVVVQNGVAPSVDAAQENPVMTDVSIEKTKDVVAVLADTGSVLVDENNVPIPLTSQEAAHALSATDPWFDAGGGVIVGYSSTGICAGIVTECHTTTTPIQAAINDVRSGGTTIFVEQGSYNEDVTVAKQVVLTGLGSGVTTNSFTLNSGANVTGSINILALVVNVNNGALVQDGVNLTAPGGTVNIGPGNYVEQVVVNGKNITLQASAPGAVIQAPASVPSCFVTSAIQRPVVCIKNASNVIIRGLTVDGRGQGNANNRLDGIGFYNAAGTVEGVTIEHIRNAPLDGVQAGVGLYVYNQDGTQRTLNVLGNTIFDYQKNGMALSGNGLTAIVQNNTVTGAGPTSLTAQNGIQLSYGAVGTISGNNVSGNFWTGSYGGSNDPLSDPNADSAAGILLYDPGSTTIQIFNNNLIGNQIGIASVGTTDLNIDGNTIQGIPHTGHGYPTGIAIWESDQWSNTLIHTAGNIQNNTITLNDYGVLVFNNPALVPPMVGIHNNSITLNTLYGVWSDTLTDATNNWWGDASGPQDASPVPDVCGVQNTNPTGSGNTVSPCVLYDPWLTKDPSIPAGSGGGGDGDGRATTSPIISSIIPVTGGQPISISCSDPSVTLQISDIQVTVTGLCGYDIVLNLVAKENLPGELGQGNSFEDGLSINLLKDGKAIEMLPAGGSLQVSYPKPIKGTPGVLAWIGSDWKEQTFSVEGNSIVANLTGPVTLALVIR